MRGTGGKSSSLENAMHPIGAANLIATNCLFFLFYYI